MPNDPADELVDHLPALRAFALSLTQNPTTADDLVQEAVTKAWSRLDSFEHGTNLRAWLFTILRNTYYSLHRRQAREVPDVDGTLVAQLSVKPLHDGRLAMRDFASAFEELPDEQREALMLVGAAGFSYEEAAEMCGVAVGTIKSRANRGRQRLADMLGLEAGEPPEMTDPETLAVVTARPGR